MKTLTGLTLSLCLMLVAGCALNRPGVKGLSETQKQYYAHVEELLRTNRIVLATGLTEQLKANHARKLNMMEWERDLQQAEVLLSVDPTVTGNKKLLAMKLAELNLEAAAQLASDRLDQSRKDAILELYDKVSSAAAQLAINSEVIVQYLGSGDRKFALRSLDVDGITRAIAGIRLIQEDLGQIEERTDEQRKNESERLQKSIDRARDLLVRVFDKNN